jgi:hypothetical protein
MVGSLWGYLQNGWQFWGLNCNFLYLKLHMNLMMIPKFFLLFLSLLKNKNVLAMLYKTIYHNLMSLISHNQEDIYVMTGSAS